jgi:beta-lactamase regulating signal transducer with metallopeptidase domain
METLLRAGLSNSVTATLMALLVTCLSRPLARRPAILHGLWLLVLLKLVTPPFYEVPIPWPVFSPRTVQVLPEPSWVEVDLLALVPGHGDATDDLRELALVPLPAGTSSDANPISSSMPPIGMSRTPLDQWLGAAWLAGSAAVLLLSFRRIRLFQRLLAEAREASPVEQASVDKWARCLGLRRAPDLWWVPGRVSPMIWFVGVRPRLILPEEFWKGLDARQRSTLLVHELAHMKRGDHYVRLLELLATALFWWHPLVWWMRGPLRDVEEQCCDAWVVWALPDAVRAYADTLLDTLEFLSRSGRPEPLLASGLGKVPHLRRRLTMIMTGTSFRLTGVRGTLGLLALAFVSLPVGATWAQKPEEPGPLKVIVKAVDGQSVLELPAELTKDDPRIFADVVLTSSEPEVVDVAVQVQDQDGSRVVATGSVDDIVKKLQAEIAELKRATSDAASSKEKIATLERALKEVRRIQGSVKELEAPAGGAEGTGVARVRYIEKLADQPEDDEKASKVMGLRKRVAELRQTMEAAAKEVQAVQAKIRELGGDPGDAPVVDWRRAANKSELKVRTFAFAKPAEGAERQVRTYTLSKPLRVEEVQTKTIAKPLKVEVRPSEPGKAEAPNPSATTKAQIRLKLDAEKARVAEVLSAGKLEILEKKLKDLQDQVERLKKGSAQGEAKK